MFGMAKATGWAWLSAMVLTACHPQGSAADLGNGQAGNEQAMLPDNPSQEQLCQSIGDESDAGKRAMMDALSEKYIGQLGAEQTTLLSKTGDYTHIGAEMLNGHCWTNGQLKSDPGDPVSFEASLRCPTLLVSLDPKQAGRTLVEDVDEKSCEFNVPLGAPSRTSTAARVQLLPAP